MIHQPLLEHERLTAAMYVQMIRRPQKIGRRRLPLAFDQPVCENRRVGFPGRDLDVPVLNHEGTYDSEPAPATQSSGALRLLWRGSPARNLRFQALNCRCCLESQTAAPFVLRPKGPPHTSPGHRPRFPFPQSNGGLKARPSPCMMVEWVGPSALQMVCRRCPGPMAQAGMVRAFGPDWIEIFVRFVLWSKRPSYLFFGPNGHLICLEAHRAAPYQGHRPRFPFPPSN